MWNLEKSYIGIYSQKRNRPTDRKKRGYQKGGGKDKYVGWDENLYTTIYQIDNQQGLMWLA